MRVIESRFLRGPNIYRLGPCFVSLLDLEGHRTVGVEELQGGAAFLQKLMPRSSAPIRIDAAETARLVARLMLAAQTWVGSPVTFCDAVSLAPTAPDRYRLLCDYQLEAVAEDTQDDDGLAAIKQFWNFPGSWNDAIDQWAQNTVGAVARDTSDHFAVAISTGGCMPALLGRVGDSPLIGCGFYAGSAGAIACTGTGEHILRHMLAARIYMALEQGIGLRRAIDEGMKRLPEHVEVGVIGITADESEVVSRKPMASAQK